MKFKLLNVLILFVILLTTCKFDYNKKSREVQVNIKSSKAETLAANKNSSAKVIRVAISTMISPKRTFFLYENLLTYIQNKIGIPIKLTQRKTYQEVNDLLEQGKLDFAYVCSGAYVVARRKFPLYILAAPKINNKTYYQAYIIVSRDTKIDSFSQLKGRSFAFSDPLSNTGYKYAILLLKKLNSTPQEFFSKTIFTYAHDYTIQAVARRLVDGGTVDGLVYDFLLKNDPDKVKNVKIIKKSPKFGIPPFVFPETANKKLIKKIQTVLLEMNNDPEGKKILKDLNIDSFEIVGPYLYDSLDSFN